jgi:hypothetical protein
LVYLQQSYRLYRYRASVFLEKTLVIQEKVEKCQKNGQLAPQHCSSMFLRRLSRRPLNRWAKGMENKKNWGRKMGEDDSCIQF